MRVMLYVTEGQYHDFHVYPQMKGAECNYPELRYTFGQVAIFHCRLWDSLRQSSPLEVRGFAPRRNGLLVLLLLLLLASVFSSWDSWQEWRSGISVSGME